MIIEGDAVSGFVFRHADGSAYGARPTPTTAEQFTLAFNGLTYSGYTEKQARAALARVRSHMGEGATAKDIVVAALRELAV